MIRRICFRCKIELGTLADPAKDEERISHGICRRCLEQLMSGKGETLDEYLDTLQVPIFVVNNDARLVTANKHALGLVEKSSNQVTGELGGEVFGCSHATQPGGCGEQVHCQSCTIRNSVEETFKTGTPSVRIPACQDLDTYEGPRKVRFVISTEKYGDVVLLRIDEAQSEPSGE